MSPGKILLALCALSLLVAIAPPPLHAQAATLPDTLRQPAGTILVPEKFLRRWDPVTIFFDRDTGPVNGGAEDNATRFVEMSPSHPGAFTWLNGRTLQFRPAEPWPALAEFQWK